MAAESWASDDSLAGIALQCSTNVHHDRPIPVNGRTTPDTCVHVPPGAHVCYGDTAVWTSHVDFDVTVDFGTSSPFDVNKFVVPKGGEIRLLVTHHGPQPPTTYSYGVAPSYCKGKETPPEVIVDN